MPDLELTTPELVSLVENLRWATRWMRDTGPVREGGIADHGLHGQARDASRAAVDELLLRELGGL